MVFLTGSAAFGVAAAVGLAVPAVAAGYLLVAGLATGILGPYMPRGLRAGFRLDAMIRRASRRWLSSASSAI
jgi:hypothetical protein